jgi:hypothetical protein
MLELYRKDGTPLLSFEGYKELHKGLTYIEGMKLFEGHEGFGKSAWGFLVFTPDKIWQYFNSLKATYGIEILKEALMRNVPLIEISEGDYNNARKVLGESDAHVEALREKWCYKYCVAHGMVVMPTGSKAIGEPLGADSWFLPHAVPILHLGSTLEA